MTMDRTLWSELFDRNNFPTFPCPSCSRGRAAIDKATFKIEEPKFSSLGRQNSEWEPAWDVDRFSFYLRCTESSCGEIIIVSGETELMDDYDEEHGWNYISALKPKSMFPAPPIIQLPKEISGAVAERIKAAFALFWTDIGSSANSLRVSVEILLDYLNVPKTRISKKVENRLN